MRRVVSAILGINTLNIIQEYNFTQLDKNLQSIYCKFDDEVDTENYDLLVKYKLPNNSIIADTYELKKELDIIVPVQALVENGILNIEFCYISKNKQDTITINKNMSVYIKKTLEVNTKLEDIVVGDNIATLLNRVTERTEDGITEIEKSKDGAIEELKKHSDSNVEESKEQVNIFTSQKQEQLDTYTKTKESQLDEYTTTKNMGLDSHTIEKKKELDNYVESSVKPQVETYIYQKADPIITAQTEVKKQELNQHVETINKPELDEYTKAKEVELDTYTGKKKSELDAYKKVKENELSSHAKLKETELDNYEKSKEQELDTYTQSKEQQLDNFTESKKKQIETQATEKITSIENKTKECIEDIYSRKDDFKGDKGDKGEPGVVDYSRVNGIVGECNGTFPLSKAGEGEIYYSDINKKYYICTESFTDRNLNVPNTENFEEISVNSVKNNELLYFNRENWDTSILNEDEKEIKWLNNILKKRTFICINIVRKKSSVNGGGYTIDLKKIKAKDGTRIIFLNNNTYTGIEINGMEYSGSDNKIINMPNYGNNITVIYTNRVWRILSGTYIFKGD